MKNRIRIIRIYVRAHLFDWPYWVIYYPDGQKSYPLHYGEAYGIAKVYGGILKIDYNLKFDI